jgi:hypothetical protein
VIFRAQAKPVDEGVPVKEVGEEGPRVNRDINYWLVSMSLIAFRFTNEEAGV